MAPRKTAKATGAATAVSTQPLAEASSNPKSVTKSTKSKRKSALDEIASPRQGDENVHFDDIGRSTSKRLRLSPQSTTPVTKAGVEGRTPIAEDNARHIRAIHRKLKELNEQVSANGGEVTDLMVGKTPDDPDNIVTESTSQDILGKIDEVLDTLGERFETLKDKIERVHVDQIMRFNDMHERFNLLENKLEEALERPTVHNGPAVYTGSCAHSR